jgi:DNA-binding LacI/PurR family transcriptional regulator
MDKKDRKQGFAAHPELINRKGRGKSGTTIAELTRQFLEEKISLTVTNTDGTKRTEKDTRENFINRRLFNIVIQPDDPGASVRAADSLRNRAYGMPAQAVDLKTQGMTVNIIPPENPEGA